MLLTIIIIIGVIVSFLLLQLLRIVAVDDFRRALDKCKKCKNYTGHDDKHRYIYCNNYAIIPEEAYECPYFQEKDKEKK